MSDVAEKLADLILLDGYLCRPEQLLDSLRHPPGRTPSGSSTEVARVATKLDDDDAVTLIRAVLDAATFGFQMLLDSNFKNSGIHARFVFEEDCVDTSEANGRFHEAYRHRIDPNGILTGVARARVEATTLTTSGPRP